MQFSSPLSDENPRLVNQAGLFSRAPFGNPIDRWITENHDPDWNSFTLIRVLVPDKERDQCLQNLNRMNINHVSLFPDLLTSTMPPKRSRALGVRGCGGA